MATERLHKVMAAAGVASRRESELLIRDGHVSVDGVVVTSPGVKVDPARQSVRVDGKPLSSHVARAVIAVYKPAGYVSTARDPQGRPTVLDLVGAEPLPGRLYPIGRLDYDSEGLLLLTNDGDLTYRLTHPRFGVEKEYVAALDREPGSRALARLASGIVLDGSRTASARLERAPDWGGRPAVWVVLHEGRRRQIRRMFAAEGLRVLRLARTRVGPIELGDLEPGEWRRLRASEVAALRAEAGAPR